LVLVGATNTSTIQQENTIRSAQSPQPQQQESVNGVKKNENNLKASRNLTLMIIFQCVLSTIGNFYFLNKYFLNFYYFFFKSGYGPFMLSYIFSFVLTTTPQLQMYSNICFGIIYLSHGLTFFVYFTFNKLFRKILIGYLHFKF
jgi:hypothetical protein